MPPALNKGVARATAPTTFHSARVDGTTQQVRRQLLNGGDAALALASVGDDHRRKKQSRAAVLESKVNALCSDTLALLENCRDAREQLKKTKQEILNNNDNNTSTNHGHSLRGGDSQVHIDMSGHSESKVQT